MTQLPTPSSPIAIGVATATLIVIALTSGLARCTPAENDATPQPTVEGAILEVGGVSIQRDQLATFDDYFYAFDPHLGRKLIARELLDQHLLPTAFANRDFAEQRAEQRQRAANLQSVAQSYLELRERGPAFGGYEPEKPYSRSNLPFPVARYAFDEMNVNRTSPPIETSQGWIVIAPREIDRGRETSRDLVHAFIVFFHTHNNHEYLEWWDETKARAGDALTYVHPDYADALPNWLDP